MHSIKIKSNFSNNWSLYIFPALPCERLPVPENGQLYPRSCMLPRVPFRTRCTFRCNRGYKRKGRAATKCLANLKWSGRAMEKPSKCVKRKRKAKSLRWLTSCFITSSLLHFPISPLPCIVHSLFKFWLLFHILYRPREFIAHQCAQVQMSVQFSYTTCIAG